MLKILLRLRSAFVNRTLLLQMGAVSVLMMVAGCLLLALSATETDPGRAVVETILGIILILTPALLFFAYGLLMFISYQQFIGVFGVGRPLNEGEHRLIRPVVEALLMRLEEEVDEAERRFMHRQEEHGSLQGALYSYRECSDRLTHAERLAQLLCPNEWGRGEEGVHTVPSRAA